LEQSGELIAVADSCASAVDLGRAFYRCGPVRCAGLISARSWLTLWQERSGFLDLSILVNEPGEELCPNLLHLLNGGHVF